MDLTEALTALTQVDAIAHALAWNDDPMTAQDRIDLYVVADRVLDRFVTTVRNSLRPEALEALAELDAPYDEVLSTAFASGVRRVRKRRAGRVEWSGWALCDALAEDMIDIGTGEIDRAVPVPRLREVLPACSDDALTSSSWNLTGVKHYVNVDIYRRAEPAEYTDSIEVDHFDDELITSIKEAD